MDDEKYADISEALDLEDVDDEDEEEEQEVEQDTEQDEPVAEEGKKKQSREENARYAQQRREAEKAAKEKAEKENHKEDDVRQAYAKGRIEGLGGINPYTEGTIESEYDLHLYDLMKQADEEGKDPLKELPRMLAREEAEKREKAKKAEEERLESEKASQSRQKAARAMIDELQKAHPECDDAWLKDKIQNDAVWKDRLSHGYTPLQIYEELNQSPGKRKSGVPSSSVSGASKKKSVRDMTDEEWEEYSKRKYGGM